MELSPSPEHQREATIEATKTFLREHEVTPFHLHDVVHVALVSSGLKPGSFITANEDETADLEHLMAQLGITWRSEPLTKDQGGKSYEIASDPAHLQRYLDADRRIPETDAPMLPEEADRVNGAFLGYPASAVDAYVDYARHFPRPHQFWFAAGRGEAVPDDVALAMHATDVIPASPHDPDVAAWGARIRSLLDRIDPTIAERFLYWERADIAKTVAAMRAENRFDDKPEQ